MKVQIFKSYWTSKIVTNAGTFHCSPEECCFNFGEEYMTYNDVKNAKRYLVKVKRMQAGLKLSMSPQQRNIFRNCGVYLSYFQTLMQYMDIYKHVFRFGQKKQDE